MEHRDWIALPAALLLFGCSSGSIVASQEHIGPEPPPPNGQVPDIQGSVTVQIPASDDQAPSSDDQLPALNGEAAPAPQEISVEESCNSMCDSFAGLQCPTVPGGASCMETCLSELNEHCGNQRVAYWQCVLDSGGVTSCNIADLETIPVPSECEDLANELLLCRCGPVFFFGQCQGLDVGGPAPDGGSG